jgi:hypothetical protein
MMSALARIARLDFCPIVPNTREGKGNNRDLKACQGVPPIRGGCRRSSMVTQLEASIRNVLYYRYIGPEPPPI